MPSDSAAIVDAKSKLVSFELMLFDFNETKTAINPLPIVINVLTKENNFSKDSLLVFSNFSKLPELKFITKVLIRLCRR